MAENIGEVISEHLLAEDTFRAWPAHLRQQILDLYISYVSFLDDDELLEDMLALGALHSEPDVRRATLVAAYNHNTTVSFQRLLEWSTGDADEQVALPAIKVARETGSLSALKTLLDITGRTVNRVERGTLDGATVTDFVAASTLRSLLEEDSAGEVIRQLPAPFAQANGKALVEKSDMVKVATGLLIRGVEQGQLPGWFPLDVIEQRKQVQVESFWIDATPVSNYEYDAFVETVESEGHLWCHTDEPLNKDHQRATAGDLRAGPECPATGVDWYDAYAYAAWTGKGLPTEDQWERAARGDENQVYPWGDSFESDYLNWATHTYSMPIGTKDDWLSVLTSVDLTTLDTLATPVSQHPENTSPFGVMGLSGNTWEWTQTRYLDRAEFSPHFGTLEIGETFGNWAAYPTVKGGSWSSVADLLSPAFRAKKHLFTRSPEISFRCVVVEGA